MGNELSTPNHDRENLDNRAVISDHPATTKATETVTSKTAITGTATTEAADMAATEADGGVPVSRPGNVSTVSRPGNVSTAPVTKNTVSAPGESVIQNAGPSWIPLPHLAKKARIEVKINGEEESFFINKDLLCSKSAFFKTVLNDDGGWPEAKTNKISIDERLDLFRIFHYWLKKGNLDFMDSANWMETAEEISIAFVEIYTFANRRGVPGLGDLILRKLDTHIRPRGRPVRVSVKVINLVLEHLPEASGLCRYLLAIERDAGRCYIPKRLSADYECLPGFFIAGLLEATEDDTDWWLTATVQKQPVNVAELSQHVKSRGGLTKVDRLGQWSRICYLLGIRETVDCGQEKLRGQFRAVSRKWLLPWDIAISPSELKKAEENCPRPLVKEYLHGAKVMDKSKSKPVSRRTYAER